MLGIPTDKFRALNGWLYNFEKQHVFKQFQIHSESGDAQMTGIEKYMQVL
jgi:hypothetical protein